MSNREERTWKLQKGRIGMQETLGKRKGGLVQSIKKARWGGITGLGWLAGHAECDTELQVCKSA